VLEAMACMATACMAMAMGCMVRIQMCMEHPLNLKNLYNMEDAWYILPCYAKNSYTPED